GANQMSFDFHRERAVPPRGELWVEGRHQRVGGDPHRRRGRIGKPEIARVPAVSLKPPHRVGDVIQRLDRVRRPGEITHKERPANLLNIEFWKNSGRLYVRQVILDDIYQTPPQIRARLIIQHQLQPSIDHCSLLSETNQKIRLSNETLFYHNTPRPSGSFRTH